MNSSKSQTSIPAVEYCNTLPALVRHHVEQDPIKFCIEINGLEKPRLVRQKCDIPYANWHTSSRYLSYLMSENVYKFSIY